MNFIQPFSDKMKISSNNSGIISKSGLRSDDIIAGNENAFQNGRTSSVSSTSSVGSTSSTGSTGTDNDSLTTVGRAEERKDRA